MGINASSPQGMRRPSLLKLNSHVDVPKEGQFYVIKGMRLQTQTGIPKVEN